MRSYRIEELAARPKAEPHRSLLNSCSSRWARLRAARSSYRGHIVNGTGKDPAHFACVKGGQRGAALVAWPVGWEF